MLSDLGIYQLDIDVEQTSIFYSKADGISCDCDGCRNYAQAAALFPPSVQKFLHQLGIDPAKPAEVYVNYAPSKETVCYGGFYHICGIIQKGTEPWVQVGEKLFQLDEQYRIELNDDYSVYFTEQVHLLEDDFPSPTIQMEIAFTIPWVLPEPNSYL